jgi:hypothetical protein
VVASEPSSLSPDDLVEIDGRCQSATPGPWQVLTDDSIDCAWLNAAGDDDQAAIALFDYRSCATNRANALFAAMARQDMPRLVAELRQLRQRVQQLLDANSKEVERRTQALRERDEALAKVAELSRQLQASP